MLGAETRRHLQHHTAYTYLADKLSCLAMVCTGGGTPGLTQLALCLKLWHHSMSR